MHRSSTVYKQKLLNVSEQEDGLFHWRKCCYGLWTGILTRSDKALMMDLFIITMQLFFSKDLTNMNLFISKDIDWSGVDYLWIIVMCLSAVWTLILTAPIHCRGFNGEQVM